MWYESCYIKCSSFFDQYVMWKLIKNMFYCKRFAQSAGPDRLRFSLLCLWELHLKNMKHRAECSPFFVCVFWRSHGVPRFCVTLVPFSVTWVPFGLHFGSIWEPFPPKVVPNGALWMYFSCQKTDWGAKGAPRGATTKINYHIWTHCGSNFNDFSHILCKNMCSFNVLVFFFNFGSHWAFHGMGSYAIRTRLCSPNTLFAFRTCS